MSNRTTLASRCIIALVALSGLVASCGPGETPIADGTPVADEPRAPSKPIADASLVESEPSGPSDSARGSDAEDTSSPTILPPSSEVTALLGDLRARFTVSAPVEPSPSEVTDDGEPIPSDAEAPAPIAVSPLGAGVAETFELGNAGIVPGFAASAPARTAALTLPRKSTVPFHLQDTATGLAVDVSLRDLRETTAESGSGYVVYRHAHASGATLLHRALPEGTEEFLHFEARPTAPSISYDLRLGNRVKGLRLVANTLELLDEKGAPRLRVSPPYLVGANNSSVEASLAVDSCAFDDDPAPPWTRPVVAPGNDVCTLRVTWPTDVVYPMLLDPKWSTTGSMIAARKNHTSTTLSTGKVLVVGGTTNGTASVASAELYDPATGVWAATASINGARQLHTATQLGTSSNATTSGMVLIAGGWNGSQSISNTRLYSPTAGTWANGGDMGTPRHNHTATVLSNGRVLVAGGMGGTSVFATATIYNPASGSGNWTSTTNMPSQRRSHTATLLTTPNATLNNKVLIVGGNSGGTTSVASVLLFNGTSWTTLTALASAREGHTATLMSDGKVLVAGGKNVSTTLATALLFNPASGNGTWTSAGTMGTARQQHTATLLSTSVVNSGLVVVAGGSNGTSAQNSAELFDGATTWTPSAPMLAAVQNQAANILANGVVLLSGGVTVTAPISAATLYDPSSGNTCSTASQCASGFCVNGVCCNSSCTGECSACNLAGFMGTCSPKSVGTACTDDGNVCTLDTCDGTNLVCQHPAGNAGAICRSSTGTCDPAEPCSGASATCPTDTFAPAGTSCADNTVCNGAETCNAGGACAPGTPLETNDNNACTDDACDPVNGVSHTPNNGPGCSGSGGGDAGSDGGDASQDGSGNASGTQGSISFYMSYDNAAPASEIAGGTATPANGQNIQQGPGLFGQALKSETPYIQWATTGNIDLGKPGAVAFWMKATTDPWEGNYELIAIHGSRKLMVFNHAGQLLTRMEHWGQSDFVQTARDVTGWSAANNDWHLVVASWGPDYVGISIDGSATQIERATWLAAVPSGPAGWLYAGGQEGPGYLRDELMVFNRAIWDREISWLWGTRLAPSSPNPAIAQFGISPSASAQGAITFYMPYELTSSRPSIAGGSLTPDVSDLMQQAPGLFGQAAKSDTSQIGLPKAGNIDLVRPGSVAFWVRPTPGQWDGHTVLQAIDGSRKLTVYSNAGKLYARMADAAQTQSVQATQGDIAAWSTTDTGWHLVVASWGLDYVGLSIDGAATTTESGSWLSGIPGGSNGWLYAGGDASPSFLRDELIVLNRSLFDSEIAWMWGTRTTASAWNPAVAKFGMSPNAPAQSAITFYMPYEIAETTSAIAGGSPSPNPISQLQQASGLFGQAVKSETPYVHWPKLNNIDLARPGSVSFWVKPTPSQWVDGNWMFIAIDGARKLMVYNYQGVLYTRMEHWGMTEWVQTGRPIPTWSTTDNDWHLVVASWGVDYVGLSLDGAPTQTQSADWLGAIAGGPDGLITAAGDASAGFLRDELIVFNRPLWDGDIAWMWGTRTTASARNPAIAKFGVPPAVNPQPSVTFHLPYETTAPTPTIAAGSATPITSQDLQLASGLFGQAVKSETPYVVWPKPNNIDLVRPGSVSFWVKPTPSQWVDGQWMFIAIDGGRKLMVYHYQGVLYTRMERFGGTEWMQTGRPIPTWSTTDNNWHLVVASWGLDHVGLSLDGSRTQTESSTWLAAIPGGTDGQVSGAGDGAAGFLRDELMIFNRPLWDGEIAWMSATRSSASVWNPAVGKFAYSPNAATQGAISFYLPYETPEAVPVIAGGSPTADKADPIQPAPGLFGKAAKSETPRIGWLKGGNIDLSRPGSVAFWVKPTPASWTSGQETFAATDGARKLTVYNDNGSLYARIERVGQSESSRATQGDISTWSTIDTGWHLVVASWGTDYVALSVDGAAPQAANAAWLAALPISGEGWLYAGGEGRAGFQRDELIVFNRVLTPSEISWIWGTRSTTSSRNPALGRFGSWCPNYDDGNPCTHDSCDEATGVAIHLRASAGTACSDGNVCNGDETCDVNGACSNGTPLNCASADACHAPGVCNPATGCSNQTHDSGWPCDDGNACTRSDVCRAGVCTGATVPGCPSKITVEDLGVLPGNHGSVAYAINDSGVVVGYSVNSSGIYRPVRWTPGSPIQELGTAAQVTYSASANGITHAGAIVGSAYGSSSSYRYTAANGFEFLTPSGQSEYGVGINESNSIVGFSGTQAFRHTAAKGHEYLGILPGGTRSWANAIDDQNNVVGESRVAWTPANDIWNPGHAVRYIDSESRLQDLNEFAPLGWELRKGTATNGDEIVGFAAHDGETHAYRLTISTGRVDDLGTFEGGGISYPLGINAAGAIVGAAYLDGTGAGNYRAAAFTERLGVVNLDSSVDPAEGWVLLQAYGVNAAGDVVGSGIHQGEARAFRMHVPGLSPARVPRCNANSDCATGFCSPEKVCCDTACTGSCSSCMVPGKVGTCSLKAVGARCSAADVCSGGDVCNASGACVAGTPPVIDDGNPCTVDSCDPSIGAKHLPVAVGTSCSDGNVCNGVETCDAVGTCSPGTPVAIDDGNACTLDACTPGGGISHTPVTAGSPCSDGNACNGVETCAAGGVCTAGTPFSIDDGNPCTIDSCEPGGSVSHASAPAGTSCSDSNVCNGAETCNAGGTCAPGTPLDWNDNNACTTDTCDPINGISHTLMAGSGCSGLLSASFHQSPVRGEPDDLLLLAGSGLSSSDRVVYKALTDTTLPLVAPTSVPTTSTASEGVASVVNIPNTSGPLDSLTVVLPAVITSGTSYALWVVNSNSQWTNGVKINDARPLWISPDIGYVSASWPDLPRQLKVIGRNLRSKPGNQTKVRLTSPAATFTLTASDDSDPTTAIEHYVAKVDLPSNMPAGDYAVSVQRDGVSWVDLTGQKFKVRTDPAPQTEFLVSNAGGCAADDGLDDTACVAAAITAAAASPTRGTVVFGPGRWDLLSANGLLYPWMGIVVADGVNLTGATGTVPTTVRVGPAWNVEPSGTPRGKPAFSAVAHNRITKIRFEDARPHGLEPEWDGFFSIGRPGMVESGIDEVVFAGNVFADPSFAIVGSPFPIKHLFVVNNVFGARHYAIRIMDNWNATDVHFRMDDSLIVGNTFKPGPFINVCANTGTGVSELGAAFRFDYSGNVFDGHATEYLGPQPVPGWAQGSLFEEGRDMSLVSQNAYSCTGDKAGAGGAVSYYGSDTAGFSAPKPAAAATANSVTVSTADGIGLTSQQHNVAVPLGSYYLNHWIQIANGRGLGQARRIASYTVDASAQTVTFVVSPPWDVAPDASSMLAVNRAAWQVYTVDNNIDNTGCTRANQNGIKAQGGITLSVPAIDTTIEGNLQRASGGISVESTYSVPFTYQGSFYRPYQSFQSFVDIQGNRIFDEVDYDSNCSTGGIGLHCSAGTGPDLSTLPASPVVVNYALNVARNQVTHADALRGGGLSMAATWLAPAGSRLYLNTLIHHNTFADLAPPAVPGTTTTSQCAAEGTRNCESPVRNVAINISLPMIHSTVVYKNTSSNVATAVIDQGTNTVQCIGAGDCSVGTCNGTPIDDGNRCTADTCGPSGPVRTPLPGASCADSSICNGYETCDTNGACGGGTSLVFDDGDPCTIDGCSESIGATHTQKPEGASCSDGNLCNGAGTCNASGQCTGGTPVTCSASDACHVAGTCDPATGQCSNPTPAPSGTPCGDTNDCNGIDRCNDVGACVTGLPPIDDGNPCTDYTCDPVTGVQQIPRTSGPCESFMPDWRRGNVRRECHLRR